MGEEGVEIYGVDAVIRLNRIMNMMYKTKTIHEEYIQYDVEDVHCMYKMCNMHVMHVYMTNYES